ncbi:MAG TPA: DUF501 domain-containing protein [Acidimicrobiales bacterium]|nr:DUF501 domain-containing protein [Acidimicrobiales bacterium]
MDDRRAVRALLGREPLGSFEVVVRDDEGAPVVLRNAPLLDDGTPMPTRYWLVGKDAKRAVDRLEAAGGVRMAEVAVDPAELALAHQRYAAERDALVPPGWTGPRPSGGVGGTRRGIKCLHAHYAWHLAGGDDPVGRWVETQLSREQLTAEGNVAAIDCGTLSTRLLVCTTKNVVLARLMRITRLGEGVDAAGRLRPEAVERTLAVLRGYREVMDSRGVRRARMVGTSALRDATNRVFFSKAASEIVGTELELLSGAEEAVLSFVGATAELGTAGGPWLVADIGGGSTELAVGVGGGRGEPAGVCSLDLGCVRVTERFFRQDPPARQELAKAARWLHDRYDEAELAVPALRTARCLVGLAGSVSALACFEQGLATYAREAVHHFVLSRAAVEAALDRLARLPARLRASQPGVEPERASFIVGGALVLSTLMEHFGLEECLVSESDILDGLARSIEGRRRAGPPTGGCGARQDRRAGHG